MGITNAGAAGGGFFASLAGYRRLAAEGAGTSFDPAIDHIKTLVRQHRTLEAAVELEKHKQELRGVIEAYQELEEMFVQHLQGSLRDVMAERKRVLELQQVMAEHGGRNDLAEELNQCISAMDTFFAADIGDLDPDRTAA
jgi:hypothetical protein